MASKDHASLINSVLQKMEDALNELKFRVPPPRLVEVAPSLGFAYRFTEKTVQQAMIQKMARIVSALNATQLLLTSGFVQEQSAMHRMIDEAQQDVTFLAYGVLKDDITSLHTKYLEDFFAETFTDPARPAESPRAYAAPPRRKIQAYLARAEGSPFDEHRGLAIMNTLHVAYSGYVHGASPHIMEMVDGDPVRFHVRGMRQTTTWQQHADDFLNYVFRSVSAFAIAAMALGHREKFDELRELSERFTETSHD